MQIQLQNYSLYIYILKCLRKYGSLNKSKNINTAMKITISLLLLCDCETPQSGLSWNCQLPACLAIENEHLTIGEICCPALGMQGKEAGGHAALGLDGSLG